MPEENNQSKFETFLNKTYKLLFVIYAPLAIVSLAAAAIVGVIGYAESIGPAASAKVVYIADLVKTAISSQYYNYIYDHRYLIAGLAFVAFVSSCLLAKFRTKKKWLGVSEALDDFQRHYGSRISKLILSYGITEEDLEYLQDELDLDFIMEMMPGELVAFLRDSMAGVSRIFTKYTGRKCHTSLKLFNNNTGVVTTYARDLVSGDRRDGIDECMTSYPYEGNSAFVQILDDENSSAFVSNRLILKSRFGSYKNAHVGWKKFYDASLVVPITANTQGGAINQQNVWGFLCVDNKGGGFDDKECQLLLSSIARIYHNIFVALSVYEQER